MISAYSPAHITCFFQPAVVQDELSSGSRGVGLRLEAGSEATAEEKLHGRTGMVVDGKPSDVPVIRMVAEILAPGRSFDIRIDNRLPPGQGFGMSAAGAVSVALCIAEITGKDSREAFEAAHIAEIRTKGGLGDVSAICCLSPQPVRIAPGLPPRGTVVGMDTGIKDVSVAVLGPRLDTPSVIGDADLSARISDSGRRHIDAYAENPSTGALFSHSNAFSSELGLESAAVSAALADLRAEGISAGMCMLGNSIFAIAPAGKVSRVLDGVPVRGTRTTGAPAAIIRKA